MTSDAAEPQGSVEQQWAFFDALATIRHRVVPVIGAGLAERAGAPASAALVAALRRAAGESALEQQPESLFDTADRLAGTHGEQWVQRQAATAVMQADLHATPVLLALARTPSRLLVTTNYDYAIEYAAGQAGLPAETLTLTDIARALEPPEDTVRVLHLHGVATQPDTIILTKASYDTALRDDWLRQLVRSLALGHRLLLLGQALDVREAHLRRDLLWASHAAAGSPLSSPPTGHLLLTAGPDRSVTARAEDLEQHAGVRLVAFDDPDRTYRFVNIAAHLLAGPAVADRADLAPAVNDRRVDPNYLPLNVAPARDIATAMGRGAYRARTWREGDVSAVDLDHRERRLLLVAGGGYGKTQELLQIARRHPGMTLYQPLAGVRPPAAGQDPAAVFVSWMRNAVSVAGDTPRLTLDRLRTESFVLLLDGFDEVATSDRPAVATVLNEIVATYPQHRWVVSSRRLPEELPALTGFAAWALLPDNSWLVRYAAQRGAEPSDLDAVLRRAPGIAELATIPIYAAGVLRHVVGGTPLPATPRELVLELADAHLDDGGRIPARRDLVRCWLDRLALHLHLLGTHEIAVPELLGLQLHQDLPSLAPDATLLGELATRALLLDDGGVARFPHNVVQEARAARALREAGDDGLATLREVVSVTLPGTAQPGSAEPVQAVRARWTNALMLALTDAPARWLEVVRAADPVLAARLTSPEAPVEQRHAAVETLWGTYRERKIWLDRGYSDEHHTDGAALLALLAAGAPDGFAEQVLAAVGDEEPTQRGNALEVLPVLLDKVQALPVVKRAIGDQDPVVRRRAAMAAYLLGLNELVDDLLEQAGVDDDQMATETLTDFALDLAPPARRISIARASPARVADRVRRRLVELVPRSELLAAVRSGELELPLLDDLTDQYRWQDREASWTPAEVLALAHITAEHEDALLGHAEVENILQAHWQICLLAWLTDAGMREREWDLWQLVMARTNAELDQLTVLLAGPPAQIAEDLGHGLTSSRPDPAGDARTEDQATRETAEATGQPAAEQVLLPQMVELLLRIATEALQARRSPPPPRPARTSPARRSLPDLVAEADREGALRRSPPRSTDPPLDPLTVDALRQWAAEQWEERLADGPLVPPDDPPAQDMTWVRSVQWAAWAQLPVLAPVWAELATAVLHLPHDGIVEWLRSQRSPACWQAVRNQLSGWSARDVLALPRLFPVPWPDGLAEVLLHHLLGPGLQDSERLAAALGVLDAGHEAAVRDWLPASGPDWMLPLRVRLGDEDAEGALLAGLISAPDTWDRWPSSPDGQWMRHVRSPTSAAALQTLIRTLLIAGHDFSDIELVFQAFERCAGADALRRYDELADDPAIPSGRYLFYQRRRVLDATAESQALDRLGSATDTAQRVRALVPPPAAPSVPLS